MPASGKPTTPLRRTSAARSLHTRAHSTPDFSLESLEPRALLYTWTAQEVYFSELVNRARANPAAEAARLGLNFSVGLAPFEQALLVPHEPLALSATLTQAARLHNADMAARSFFDHTNPDGLSPTNRANAAGYAGTAGENIGANFSSINALYFDWMSTPTERKNILSLNGWFDASYHYDHIGPGFLLNAPGALYPNYYTVEFGNPSSQTRTPYLLGVVFSDVSNDNFYSIGEGAAGVRVDVFSGSTATGTPAATYTTDAAGNYQLPLATGAYTVVFTRLSDNYSVTKAATIGSENVRLNTKSSELAPPPPPPDDFADAGDWSGAGTITINQTTGSGSRSGTLAHAGDTDLFVFTAAKTGTTRISGVPTSAAYDGRIRIYNSAQSLIASGADGTNPADSVADVALTAGSTYYILFSATSNTSTGAYTVSIEGPPTPPDDFANSGQWSSAASITINQTSAGGTISGTLGVSADTDLFTFIAARTGTTRITGSPNSGAYDGRIQVYDAAHTLIATGADGTLATDSTATLSLTTGSVYFILFSATNNTATGNYVVSIQGPPPPPPPDDFADEGDWTNAAAIQINSISGSGSRSGVVEVGGDSDLFTFTAARSGITALSVTAGSGLTTRLRVYDALHNLLATGDPGATLTLTGGQTYFLLVDSANPSLIGTYSAQITGPEIPPVDDFADGGEWSSAAVIDIDPTTGSGSRSGVLEVGGDSDLFSFTAARSGITSLSVTAGSGLTTRLRVYDALHNLIATGDPGATLILTGGQTYFLLVDSANPSLVGTYTAQVTGPDAPPHDDFADGGEWSGAAVIEIVSISGDGSRSGVLEVGGDSDLFTFTATQTGITTLSAIAGAGLIARLRVYDALHNLLATGDPGTTPANSVATLTLTSGQTYFLLIDSADTSQTGAYTAQVTGPVIPPPPPDDFADGEDWSNAAPLDLNSATGNGSRSGTIEVATDSDLFTFITVKGGLTTIAASIGGTSTLVARLRLYDANHTLIATGAPGTNGLDSILSATLTEGARYYILVDSADGATIGEYTTQLIAPAIPQNALASGGQPTNQLWLAGRPVVAFVNQLGRPIVALRTPQGAWTSTDLRTATNSPAISGDLLTWIDSRDGLLYAAARSAVGVIVYKRSATGQWTYRNLTAEIAVSRNIVSNLTTFTDSGGLRQIGGLDANGRLVTYWMTGIMWPQGWRYFFTDITSRDLVRRNRPMPAFGGTLTSYVTQKNSLNIVGMNPAGQVVLFFRPGGGLATQLWNWANLSVLTGVPALVGTLTATETSTRIVNISGTDASGNVWMITWRSGDGWRARNITAAAAGAAPLVAGSLTSWVNASGAGFVAGITTGGAIVLYRYTFTNSQSVWSFAAISAGVANAPRPVGALRSSITSAGAILIAGTTSTGEVVRFTFGTNWTAESISQLLP